MLLRRFSHLAASLISLGLLGPGPAQALIQPVYGQGDPVLNKVLDPLPGPPPGHIMANGHYPSAVVNSHLSLEGPLWRLLSYPSAGGESLPAVAYSTQSPSIQFTAGQISGNGTCNRFFGAYELDGDRLVIQPGGSTLMACPPALMAQEQGFMTALERVDRYEISAGELHLFDAHGNSLLTFAELVPPDLVGPQWELTAYNNGHGGLVSGLMGSRITLIFDQEGQVTGFAGCNNYRASYAHRGDTLTIGATATTRKLCPQPDGVMAQEAAYLTALASATSYLIADQVLTLKTSTGATAARFRAIA